MARDRLIPRLAVATSAAVQGNWIDEFLHAHYNELRALVRGQLRKLRPGRTLDTTALAHEAYCKLAEGQSKQPNEPSHLLAIAATTMRHLLVDEIRRRNSAKRGSGEHPKTLDETLMGSSLDPVRVLAVDQALGELAQLDQRLVRLVELRYFAGLTIAETATALERSERSVKRDWRKAKALLADLLSDSEERA